MTIHCQVCGRGKRLLSSGLVVRHYYHSDLCLGSLSLPYEVADEAIEEAEAHWIRQANRYTRRWEQHRAARQNEPLPADFWAAWARASREAERLRRRLLNWSKRGADQRRVGAAF